MTNIKTQCTEADVEIIIYVLSKIMEQYNTIKIGTIDETEPIDEVIIKGHYQTQRSKVIRLIMI